MSTPTLVVTTCANTREAELLAKDLVERKLAACVQMHTINSVYRWQDKVEQESEVQLMIKTTSRTYPRLEEWIKDHHSYDVPEIIALPIEAGSKEYLRWIEKSVER